MIMKTPAKQAPTASSEIAMLIRKLRWAGLDEKAKQLENELEQRPVTDTVVSRYKMRRTNTNEV
jgi:hypothetical protein